jgi:hypothetical protein
MDGMYGDAGGGVGGKRGAVSSARTAWERRVQAALDASVPHTAPRWAAFAGVVLIYALRVFFLQGFYIVTYGIAIFNLNLIIGFLSPAFDPEQQEGPTLPTTEQEFKPFVRRVPEFKFWCARTAAARAVPCRRECFWPAKGFRAMWKTLRAAPPCRRAAARAGRRSCHACGEPRRERAANARRQRARLHALLTWALTRVFVSCALTLPRRRCALSPPQAQLHQVLPHRLRHDLLPHVRCAWCAHGAALGAALALCASARVRALTRALAPRARCHALAAPAVFWPILLMYWVRAPRRARCARSAALHRSRTRTR